MKIAEIIQTIEQFAPISYQESYDNAGLLTGDKLTECTGALIALDVTEAVVEEAIALGYNLIVAHHPIIFSGLKRLTGSNYIERTVIKAIKNDIAIYAAHTNLDHVHNGVNNAIADQLGLVNRCILEPKKGIIKKLVTYIPTAKKELLLGALFAAGAGHIGNYSECSFAVEGQGTFKAKDGAQPFIGSIGLRHTEQESKVEFIFPEHLESTILHALKDNHPYEEIAYEIIRLENKHQEVGSGMIGELTNSMEAMDFLHLLREKMQAACVRYTAPLGKPIHRVALCGGSGSFLLNQAISQKADIFISADFKYHQFFDADNQIVIADIGHYESEQYTSQLFNKIISDIFPNFALRISSINTNPIKYL